MTRMYPNTRKALEEAGWYPGRCLESTPFEQKMREKSYDIYEPVLAFLQEFGDLKIKEGYGRIRIANPNELPDLKKYREYEALIKEPVMAVGSTGDGTGELLITASGKILGSGGVYLGDDAIDAFNNLVYGTGGKSSIRSYLYSLEKCPTGDICIETYYHLGLAGWYDGRNLDTREFERAMKKAGCEPNPAAVKFYQEFGRLTVPCIDENKQVHISTEYLKMIPSDCWKKCREYLGEPATVVGVTFYEEDYIRKKRIAHAIFEESYPKTRKMEYALIVTESNQVHGFRLQNFESFTEQGGRKFGDSFMEGWEELILCCEEPWYSVRVRKEMAEYPQIAEVGESMVYDYTPAIYSKLSAANGETYAKVDSILKETDLGRLRKKIAHTKMVTETLSADLLWEKEQCQKNGGKKPPTRMYPNTRKALEEAGWYPGRCIDTTNYEKMLLEGGYELYEPLLAFCREFGGLKIRIENNEDFYFFIDDVSKYTGKVDSRRSFEKCLGEPVFYIGSIGDITISLYVTASARIVDDYGTCAGENAIDSLNKLVYGLWGESIKKKYEWEDKIPKGYVHDETYNLLREGGWYPGRCIDTTEFERAMQEAGCELNPAAVKFYQEFGELKLSYKGDNIDVHISPEYLQVISENSWEQCRNYLGEPATVVGVTFFDDYYPRKRSIGYAIIVTESNQVHGVWHLEFKKFDDKGGIKFGDSIMEGWEKMLLDYGKERWYDIRVKKEMEKYFAELDIYLD